MSESNALPTPESQIESLQRALLEASQERDAVIRMHDACHATEDDRIAQLEQANAELTAQLQEARRERDELLGARCDAETQRIMLRNVERQLAEQQKAADALRTLMQAVGYCPRCHWSFAWGGDRPAHKKDCPTCAPARAAIDAAREQPAAPTKVNEKTEAR